MAKKTKHRKMNDGSYSWIHDSLKGYIDEIKSQGLTLYWVITTHAIGKEYIWVGQKKLAKESALSKPTVNKYLKILENAKLIKRVKRREDETDIIHLLKIRPRVVKEFNQGGKGGLPPVVKEFNQGGKGG